MSQPPDIEGRLDQAINDAIEVLNTLSPDEEAYAKTVTQLSKLHNLKMEQKKHQLDDATVALKHQLELTTLEHQKELDARPQKVSKDTALLVAGNLLGIVMIVGHERAHIIASKAITFIKPLR